ncbi:MAG TPA: hypothetical protein VNZ64_19390 [Candidatus Acidoferrum sp.]|jgi:hypothetical protein|nr:hypothetical protein [Candidatus Acidoferrum sp.]
MNKPEAGAAVLPGLDSVSLAPMLPAASALPARPRVKPVDRSQLSWQMLDVERLIEQDHPARAIWEAVKKMAERSKTQNAPVDNQ